MRFVLVGDDARDHRSRRGGWSGAVTQERGRGARAGGIDYIAQPPERVCDLRQAPLPRMTQLMGDAISTALPRELSDTLEQHMQLQIDRCGVG